MPEFDDTLPTMNLPQALLRSASLAGRKTPILQDQNLEPVSYDRIILGAQILGRRFAGQTEPGEAVGVLLPNVNAVAVTIFALAWHGRVAAMLNFSAGLRNVRSACATAEVKLVVTSRLFVVKAGLQDLVAGLADDGLNIVYLEDVRKNLTALHKLRGVWDKLRASATARTCASKPSDPAFILFTSGSEGDPKGVVLSHANVLTNIAQVGAHIDLSRFRSFFNPLPVFHCFGLTGGLLLPLMNGIHVTLYPSPLHYREIPKLVGEVDADLLFGTDTFVAGYARAAAPEDLQSVKMIVCGAERVKPETRALWQSHGTEIVEGYGVTECSPVLALNQPEDNHHGTVGQLLPGIEFELEKVKGIKEGGRLKVKGGNVMQGYLLPSGGELVPPPGGWHDTGDIVEFDKNGFITIKGRAKRFAKLGGEMVSLGAIEAMASGCWPDHSHVAVTLPDGRKGERVIILTDQPDAARDALAAYAKSQDMPELWVPKAVLVVEDIPVLGSGKTDYAGAQRLAEERQSLL